MMALSVIGYATDVHGVVHAYASDGHALCSQYVGIVSLTGTAVSCVKCMRSVSR